MSRLRPFVAVAAIAAALASSACKKASKAQCDQLVERYAMLVVKEKHPDASAEVVIAEQAREKKEARDDEAFRNCPSEVTKRELDCAMSAPTTDAMLKCLE